MACSICREDGHNKMTCKNKKEQKMKQQENKKPITKEDFIQSRWCDYLLDSVVNCINNLDSTNLGKILAPAAELYICDILSESGINAKIELSAGYDIDLCGKKAQAKYRFTNGVTPFSKQLHFENTRRHSTKNQGDASKSGHVSYATKEFDCVIPLIIHCRDSDMNPSNYLQALNNPYTMIIPVEDLEDPKRPGFCKNQIPSEALEKNKGNIQNFLKLEEKNA
jgi:hypothetical protein